MPVNSTSNTVHPSFYELFSTNYRRHSDEDWTQAQAQLYAQDWFAVIEKRAREEEREHRRQTSLRRAKEQVMEFKFHYLDVVAMINSGPRRPEPVQPFPKPWLDEQPTPSRGARRALSSLLDDSSSDAPSTSTSIPAPPSMGLSGSRPPAPASDFLSNNPGSASKPPTRIGPSAGEGHQGSAMVEFVNTLIDRIEKRRGNKMMTDSPVKKLGEH